MDIGDRVYHRRFGHGEFKGFVRAGTRDGRYARVIFERDHREHRVMETTLSPSAGGEGVVGDGGRVRVTVGLLRDVRFLVHPDHHASNLERANRTFKAINEIIEEREKVQRERAQREAREKGHP